VGAKWKAALPTLLYIYIRYAIIVVFTSQLLLCCSAVARLVSIMRRKRVSPGGEGGRWVEKSLNEKRLEPNEMRGIVLSHVEYIIHHL
jgi:hypothetical protein